jgi:hypothetical protein
MCFARLVPPPTYDAWQKLAGIHAIASIPLMAQEMGVLLAGSSKEEISQRELMFLQAFAQQAATAIEKAQFLAETEHRLTKGVPLASPCPYLRLFWRWNRQLTKRSIRVLNRSFMVLLCSPDHIGTVLWYPIMGNWS